MYARSRYGGAFAPGGATPITFGIIIAVCALYILGLAQIGMPLLAFLPFSPDHFPAWFWTVLTWPIFPLMGEPIQMLFTMGWFYFVSSSLERSWSTRDYGVILGLLTVMLAMLTWARYLSVHSDAPIAGIPLLAGPLAVAWAVINRRETVMIWFLPVPAPVIGWLGVAETWYFGGGGPLGLFLLPACGIMYWYVTQGRYATGSGGSGGGGGATFANPFRDRHKSGLRLEDFDRTPGRRNEPLEEDTRRPFNLLRWWRDRREKKRLEEIFRRSGFTDDDERR